MTYETEECALWRTSYVEKLRGIYVLIDPEQIDGQDPLELARRILDGGAGAIQVRDKRPNIRDTLLMAEQLLKICNEYEVACIINDRVDVAVSIGADGVHLGQQDLPAKDARRLMKPWQIIGTSNALFGEAQVAIEENVDYVAVGDIFGTKSKNDTRPAGIELLRQVRGLIPMQGPPLIAIGGINASNVSQTACAGADGIAVMSAVTQAQDPTLAVRRLLKNFFCH